MQNGGNESPPWSEGGGLASLNVKLIARIGIIIAAVILLIVALFFAKGVYTDWLWFDSIGYLSVFKKILILRIWLFFAGAIIAAAVLLANLYVAYRFSRGESVLPVPPEVLRLTRMAIIAGVALTVFIAAIIFGAIAQGRWETFLVFFNKVPFGVEDPQFNKDMAFHVATMPVLHFIQGWLMGLAITSLVLSAALYLVIFAARGVKFAFTSRIMGHIAVLGAVLMLAIAAAHYLDIFELVFSGRGAAPGAGNADVNARVPVLWLLVAIAVVSAVGFVVSNFYGGLRLIIASFSLWVVIAILAGALYPASFQRFRINPNEFDREEKFIERAIEATRAAYNLNLIQDKPFIYNPDLSREIIDNNQGTIKNIRLWDDRPLLDTYNQIQTFRQYYNFVDVDVDRYRFADGEIRQVMLAARELFPEDLEQDAQNWVNRKLAYTHGFGVSMSPVNRFTPEGRPEFFLQDLPPTGDLVVQRPEIYYGENTKNFIIVNTDTQEFNYPGPAGDPLYQNYTGEGGVKVGSFLRRLAYAGEFLDLNILISGQIKAGSKIQYRRNIQDRVKAIAPFLRLDADPYLVVGEGEKLWWIQDAYTVTDRYAYSAQFQDDFNYIRNSVKIVIDPYEGNVHFFVFDPDDPIIQIYRGAFPDLFKDFDEIDSLDPSLRDHIRYPMGMFSTQAELYLRYHMRVPKTFFSREDLWAPAKEVFNQPTNTQDIEPYYLIMKLPGGEKAEFVLLMPFTPGGEEKKNMVGWMAARSDGENYGKLVTFVFPKDRQVFGPEQIEGRITGDEKIGRELSLLCPEGKLCIRGNLLAIPMDDSLLYVEPLYIRAQALPLPELKKVIVADANKVIMADTFSEALSLLLGEAAEPDPGDGVVTPPSGQPPATGPVLDQLRKEFGALEDAVGELEKGIGTLEKSLERIEKVLEGASSEGESQ